MTGYSKTPLFKKIGYIDGFKAKVINEPSNYLSLLEGIPQIEFNNKDRGDYDLIHLLTTNFKDLKTNLKELKKEIKKNGMIWISWPKRSSKIASDLDENKIRNLALEEGLVDVKVCAIDDNWSGLKLIYRLKDR